LPFATVPIAKPEFRIYVKMKKEEGGRRKKTKEGGLQSFLPPA